MIGAGVTRCERWVVRPLVWVFLMAPHEARMALRRRRNEREAAKRTVDAAARESDTLLRYREGAAEIDLDGDAVAPLTRERAARRERRLREIAEGTGRPMIRAEDIRRVGDFRGRRRDG